MPALLVTKPSASIAAMVSSEYFTMLSVLRYVFTIFGNE